MEKVKSQQFYKENFYKLRHLWGKNNVICFAQSGNKCIRDLDTSMVPRDGINALLVLSLPYNMGILSFVVVYEYNLVENNKLQLSKNIYS
jgi:hypothetical protein